MNENTKFCINCKYFNTSHDVYGHICICPVFDKIDIVTGGLRTQFCSILRYDENKCGINGKYWKDKNMGE